MALAVAVATGLRVAALVSRYSLPRWTSGGDSA
jgi:hypothetical protein